MFMLEVPLTWNQGALEHCPQEWVDSIIETLGIQFRRSIIPDLSIASRCLEVVCVSDHGKVGARRGSIWPRFGTSF